MKLRTALIRLDLVTQPRAQIDSKIIAEYREAMAAGTQFPSVVVFYDGQDYWLADGYHRIYAAQALGREEVEADVRQGSQRRAILYSVGANADHGVRRTNADKRKSVETLLHDPEWAKWSDRKIAKQAKVTQPFVGKVRSELSDNRYQTDSSTQRQVSRGGSVYTMDISGQRDRAGTEPLPVPPETAPSEIQPRLLEYPESPSATPPPPIQPVVEPVVPSPATTSTPSTPVVESKFNRTNESIDWAQWSWNPVTGCKTGCSYCYARVLAIRFWGSFEPTFHPERLDAPSNTEVPVLGTDAPVQERQAARTVFVCSMADLFGPWVPQEWIDGVLGAVREAPQWTFIFLTKYPRRLTEIDWPPNCWVGATVDIQSRVAHTVEAFRSIRAPVRFISCEPLREQLTFEDMSMLDWVIIGGQSETNPGEPARQPRWEWVEHLHYQARQAGCRVYWKPNLTVRPREYVHREG